MTRILVDENILGAAQLLGPLGEIERFRGRDLQNHDLKGVEALLVRSVTPVNDALLNGTDVRFVGSTTIGTDHLDIDWLEQQGIAWCNAPGSNANSVVDYCLSAFAALPGVLEALLAGARVGIIGYGNVGARLHRRLARLGIDCIAYDPLLDPHTCPIQAPLDAILRCPVVSLHTPLIRSGDYPTVQMLSLDALRNLPQGAVLLNAGRGEVLATAELKALLKARPDIRLVLDVWENEPGIDAELVRACALATPHIAGYSQDGKWRGLWQVAERLAVLLGRELPEIEAGSLLAAEPVLDFGELAPNGPDVKAALIRHAIQACYDVRRDDRALRELAMEKCDLAAGFDRLRREYPARRELSSLRVTGEPDEESGQTLAALKIAD